MEEFNTMQKKTTETLREFYARLITLVTEIRTVYKRDILDEDVRKAFKSQLSEASKINFLLLEKSAEYKDQLNDLCQEIIRRDEELNQGQEPLVTANNMNLDKLRQKGCFNCGKPGHRARDCWTRPNKRDDSIDWRAGKGKYQRFDKKKQLSITIDGNPRRDKNVAAQVNLAEAADEEDDGEEIVECYVCHQRGDRYSNACPNGDVEITMKNRKFREYGKKNAQDDAKGPPKKIRVA